MKKAVYIGLLLLLSVSSSADSDISKIEQYCQIVATPRLVSNKVTIDIKLRQEIGFWRDTRLTRYDGKVKKFNTIVDELNCMGNEGWIIINAYPIRNHDSDIYHFGFKKVFTRSEIESL